MPTTPEKQAALLLSMYSEPNYNGVQAFAAQATEGAKQLQQRAIDAKVKADKLREEAAKAANEALIQANEATREALIQAKIRAKKAATNAKIRADELGAQAKAAARQAKIRADELGAQTKEAANNYIHETAPRQAKEVAESAAAVAESMKDGTVAAGTFAKNIYDEIEREKMQKAFKNPDAQCNWLRPPDTVAAFLDAKGYEQGYEQVAQAVKTLHNMFQHEKIPKDGYCINANAENVRAIKDALTTMTIFMDIFGPAELKKYTKEKRKNEGFGWNSINFKDAVLNKSVNHTWIETLDKLKEYIGGEGSKNPGGLIDINGMNKDRRHCGTHDPFKWLAQKVNHKYMQHENYVNKNTLTFSNKYVSTDFFQKDKRNESNEALEKFVNDTNCKKDEEGDKSAESA